MSGIIPTPKGHPLEGTVLPVITVSQDHKEMLMAVAAEAVSDQTRVSVKHLMGRIRTEAIARARFILYKIIRHEIDIDGDPIPFDEIAKYIGGRDHGTVIHGINTLEQLLSYDKKIMAEYRAALSRFEIMRAEYISVNIGEITASEISGLESACVTIRQAIRKHKDELKNMQRQLKECESLREAENERMV